jgi:hypothetical protein
MKRIAMHVKQQINRILRDTRGGLGFNAIWVCFVIIFLIPFFWDVASVHYARRFAGTGADAGSLAAAQEYVRQLQYLPEWNGIFRGRCELGEFTPQQVVMRYRTHPAFGAPPGIGQGYATSYAAQNRDELTTYRSWPEYGGTQVEGIPIPWIKVYVETQRRVNTAYGPLYQRDFDVPNRGLAVAYLWRWNEMPRPCPDGEHVTYDFTFAWKITLDKAR